MKKKRLVFATNNHHKLEEVRNLLPSHIEILSLEDIGCNVDIPETGNTLAENALLKARYVYQHYKLDCFSDDTGLEVTALGGLPGVHTARYAYPDKHDHEANVQKLLQELSNKTDRTARFRTVIALIEGGEENLFEGEVWGTIETEQRGEEGFGYDPIFSPQAMAGKTFAELGVAVKNQLSHRAIAVQKLAEYLKENKV